MSDSVIGKGGAESDEARQGLWSGRKRAMMKQEKPAAVGCGMCMCMYSMYSMYMWIVCTRTWTYKASEQAAKKGLKKEGGLAMDGRADGWDGWDDLQGRETEILKVASERGD
jgi:hypothetical protein